MIDDRASRPTEASLLTERLRAEILSGSVAPGARLKLEPLAARYEVSRGPLREAASRLAAEGLVTIEDQRGFRVAPISRADLLDATATRQQIEAMTLRDSLARGDLAWEGRVLAAAHVLERLTPPAPDDASRAEFARAHKDFHEALVSACASTYLLGFREQLYAVTERYRNLAAARYARPAHKRDVAAEHRALAETAIARDADRAVALLTEHLDATARTLLEDYPALFGEE